MFSRFLPSFRSYAPNLLRFFSINTRGYHFQPRRHFSWSKELETDIKLPKVSDIINEDTIHYHLKKTQEDAKNPKIIKDILSHAIDNALLKTVVAGSEYIQGLSLEETATLLNIDTHNKELCKSLYNTAYAIKTRIYGNRIVLFAPVYLSDYCINKCAYCSFQIDNTIPRMSLNNAQLINEVETLQRMGHRRLLFLCGESPQYTFDDFLNSLVLANSVKTPPHGDIRRINVEIPALSISDFRRLKNTNCVGTYTLFQETYHRDTFKKVHPENTPKGDFDHRLLTMDRAQIAKMDDVGIGALFGLYDYRFEVLAMLMHSTHLDKTYGAGPHTISIPRIQPAVGAPLSKKPLYEVSDDDFKKLVATIRCAVPYTGMILSTRESPQMRRELLNLGISQISAGSKTSVGSYHKGELKGECEECDSDCNHEKDNSSSGQFSTQDTRNLDEVVQELLIDGFIPSWCTACYRLGRTGPRFMQIAKRGDIHNYCHPNALVTLKEYALDYGSDKTKKLAKDIIEKEKETIKKASSKKVLDSQLEQLDKGKRDLYF